MQGAIIYISSNRENPEFENKIKDDIRHKKGDLIMFEVTQDSKESSIASEYQMHVGNVGTSGFNFCRQLQLATEMAFKNNIDYVISCEADCLYSPDYFKFVPKKLDTVYRNTNNYVLALDGKWYKKDSQTAFQIAGTKYLLDRLNYLLKDQPQWNTEMKNFPKEIGKRFLDSWDTFKTEYPCFGIKTGKGMRNQTKHGKEAFNELPYWGKVENIINKYKIYE